MVDLINIYNLNQRFLKEKTLLKRNKSFEKIKTLREIQVRKKRNSFPKPKSSVVKQPLWKEKFLVEITTFDIFLKKEILKTIIINLDDNRKFKGEKSKLVINFLVENPECFRTMMNEFKNKQKNIIEILFSMVNNYTTLNLMTKCTIDENIKVFYINQIKQTILQLMYEDSKLPDKTILYNL